jgi:hypothetical protein
LTIEKRRRQRAVKGAGDGSELDDTTGAVDGETHLGDGAIRTFQAARRVSILARR